MSNWGDDIRELARLALFAVVFVAVPIAVAAALVRGCS